MEVFDSSNTPSIGIAQKIPPPEEFFGFKAGADFHLLYYEQAVDYWKKLEKLSGKIKLFEYGKSSGGKTMIFAAISSEENMAKLDHYKELSKRLSLVRGLADEEAGSLASEGKAIVWIDGGLHATEVAPAQHIIQLTYDLLTAPLSKPCRYLKNKSSLWSWGGILKKISFLADEDAGRKISSKQGCSGRSALWQGQNYTSWF